MLSKAFALPLRSKHQQANFIRPVKNDWARCLCLGIWAYVCVFWDSRPRSIEEGSLGAPNSALCIVVATLGYLDPSLAKRPRYRVVLRPGEWNQTCTGGALAGASSDNRLGLKFF